MNQASSDTLALMRYDASKKSVGVAYLLWFFLGVFGAHRFYLGKIGSAILLLVITLIGAVAVFPLIITAIWLLIDLFLIPSITRRINLKIAAAMGLGHPFS